MVLRASEVLPCIAKPPSQPQGAGAANVRAGAERHPVGWVPALPAGFLSNVKPRDVEEAHRATLWPNWRPESHRVSAQLRLTHGLQVVRTDLSEV